MLWVSPPPPLPPPPPPKVDIGCPLPPWLVAPLKERIVRVVHDLKESCVNPEHFQVQNLPRLPPHPVLKAPILLPMPDLAMGGCPPAPPVGWCGEAGTLPPPPPPSAALTARATGLLEMGERGRYCDGWKRERLLKVYFITAAFFCMEIGEFRNTFFWYSAKD